jgi:NAD(P)-dependent dehydrogenase (short-subunit alcohol dehydrogenase family)
MIAAGSGAIIVTGNTSTRRGKAGFAAFAPTKAAQRILAESMAHTLGPRGVHVAYVVIDAVIDVPWTRRAYPNRPDEYFAGPSAIADAVLHLAHQDRSAWTFELDLRPFGEEW